MVQPKISIIIVTWNAEAFIEKCLQSIFEQNLPSQFKNNQQHNWFDLLIIDNNSGDDTLSLINENFSNRLKIVKNKQNIGFAKAYNQGIHWTSGRYVLVLNQDVYLDKNFLIEIINFLDSYPKVAAVNPFIFKWLTQPSEKIIDSLGLGFDKQFRFFNLGEGQKVDDFIQADIKPVFGFTGTAAMFRRSALYDIAYNKEFFDESFFAYKEDVDLSWRLRWRNWDIVNLPSAIAYHKRTASQTFENKNHKIFIDNYLKKPKFINFFSYRNHLYCLIKNLSWQLIWYNFLFIFWYEIKKAIFLVFTNPKIFFQAWYDVIKNFNMLLNKRKFIFTNKKIKSNGLLIWLK
jgi:GT2 family glycosyltransferase